MDKVRENSNLNNVDTCGRIFREFRELYQTQSCHPFRAG